MAVDITVEILAKLEDLSVDPLVLGLATVEMSHSGIEIHVRQSRITRKMLEDAGADARDLMESSPPIPKLVGLDVIARQLFLLIRNALDGEIKANWDIEHPDLVIRTLGMSAERRAVNSLITAVQMRDLLLLNVIPAIEAFCQMEEDDTAVGRTE